MSEPLQEVTGSCRGSGENEGRDKCAPDPKERRLNDSQYQIKKIVKLVGKREGR